MKKIVTIFVLISLVCLSAALLAQEQNYVGAKGGFPAC
jgi:hypothetical protein